MAWTLHFLVWITVVATATGYKYPIRPQQLQYAAFPLEAQDYNAAAPDCRLTQRSSEDVKAPPSADEVITRRSGNGSSKILNNYVKATSRRGQIPSNQIIFPGPTAIVTRQLDPIIPDSCKGSTICEEVENYPQDQIDKLISESDINNFQIYSDPAETPDITQRLGPSEENIELCNSQIKVTGPQAVAGVDGQWYTLVNNKARDLQQFKVEICDKPEAPCSDIAVFMQGYTARCIQKYVQRVALVAVKNADGTTQTAEKLIKLPSCCACVAKANIT